MRFRKPWCVMVAVLVLMSTAVNAAEYSLLADLCPQCNTGDLTFRRIIREEWIKYDFELCTHGGATDYNDRLVKRKVYRYYECNNANCEYGERIDDGYEYAVYCTYENKYYY